MAIFHSCVNLPEGTILNDAIHDANGLSRCLGITTGQGRRGRPGQFCGFLRSGCEVDAGDGDEADLHHRTGREWSPWVICYIAIEKME